MTERRPPGHSDRNRSSIERRVAPASGDAASGSLRKVKGALGRPISLERREGQLRIVLVERRLTAPADQAPLLARICSELQVRLADLADTAAAPRVRDLGRVCAELERKGWPGVEALSGTVLAQSLDQAELMASERPSDLLAIFNARLRLLEAAADKREARLSRLQGPDPSSLIVTETTHEEFEASQRSWEATVPSRLGPRFGSDE